MLVSTTKTLSPNIGEAKSSPGENEKRNEKRSMSVVARERSSGGKRICIQDADGKIFFLQCPEGFAGGNVEDSAVPLAAWVSSVRKRPKLEDKSAFLPASRSSPTYPDPHDSDGPSSSPKYHSAVDRKPIQYETGYDPLTGEIKGPDIDPAEILGAGFCRNESSAVRDVNSTEDLNKAWFTTAKDKEALIDKGINWKQGAWSQEEVSILNDNIKEYCSARGIDDPARVIFEMSKEERSDFYPTIAKGLQRPLFAVYRRVKRDYDVNNHKGVYTQAEVEKLKGLLKQFGPDWKLIGEKLGRSAQSVKDRCRQFKELGTMNNGAWSVEEEKRLIMAVHEVGRPANGAGGEGGGEWVVSASKWRTAASLVKTRTEKQCRLKWSEIVKASISVGGGGGDAPRPVTSFSPTRNDGETADARSAVESIAEWGSEEDAHLLSTLNKVINNSQPHENSAFKTNRIDASDFVGAIISSGNRIGHANIEDFSPRDVILTAVGSSSSHAGGPVVVSNSAQLLPGTSIAQTSSNEDHASVVAAAATAGLVTSAIHFPASSLQQHQLQQHVMPDGNYIWTHHPL